MFNLDGKNWITSKDLIKRTGISRATLNNYIKAGILPKPVVKKGNLGMKGTKQIGFFPIGVLDRITLVRRLKREGLTMEQIAERCQQIWVSDKTDSHASDTQEAVVPTLETPDQADVRPAVDSPAAEKDGSNIEISQEREFKVSRSAHHVETQTLALTISNIKSPAYLINRSHEVEWINDEAQRIIFNKQIDANVDIASRNIFKLLFSWDFHAQVSNWKEVIACHLQIAQPCLSKDQLKNVFQGISERETTVLENLYDQRSNVDDGSIRDFPINLNLADGSSQAYKIYTISFREGLFVVYVPTDQVSHDILQILGHRERIISELLSQRMPSLVSLCVLVADLQDSIKLSSELLPVEYFELVNSLWQSLGTVFNKYSGIYGKHVGDGMLYYFVKKPGVNYIMDAINCSMELRDKMKEFSSQWKLRKGWLNDLYLNTGINEGQEFFGTIQYGTNIEFSALGDTINYAGRLSDFSRYGGIWTTKNVIGKLSQDELKALRFGVHRQDGDRTIFIRNSFSRVMDMLDINHPKYSKFSDIATLPITELSGRIEHEDTANTGSRQIV